MQWIDKTQIASAFGRAVNTYDHVATLQRDIADQLIMKIINHHSNGKVLDAGCGTGYVSQQLKRTGIYNITALDLSASMLVKAKSEQVADDYIEGDIENLPLLSEQFDVVVSSLAVQWCHSFKSAIIEMVRVLKPQGRLYVATLVQPTLNELREAWAAIDDEPHVINFLTEHNCENSIASLVNEINIASIEIKSYTKMLEFDDIFSLLKSLQGIGATALPVRKKGLMGRAKLKALEKAYPKCTDAQKFRLTYQVLELIIVKA